MVFPFFHISLAGFHSFFKLQLSTIFFSMRFFTEFSQLKPLCIPSLPVHCQLPEFTEIHVHWVGDAIQPSHPLSTLLFLPSIFPSIRVFSTESVLHIRWLKYRSFSFSISPFNEYSGLISFRMDWLDFLAVQGTLRSLIQHHSSKASILSVLSFLYSSTLPSIHDYWKNHCFD